MSPGPRISPGTPADIGRLNFAIARVIGAATGGGPPNVFTTLARNRRIFRPWLRFAGSLMPNGQLPRDESELVILRVAHNCESGYEWSQHERLGAQEGLSAEEIERVRSGPAAEGWSARRRALLHATDELHRERAISDDTWAELAAHLREHELIELCLLVGHYEMLAMTLNSLRVQEDAPPGGPPTRLMRVVQAVANRRRR